MAAKILVVDDEQLLEYVIRQKFRHQIRAKEFEFVFARNGREALDKLADSSPFDLVLTDINMPEMDGFTLLQRLSKIDKTLKAIVISAYGDLQNIRTAMNQGAFDFLTKPIDFQDMEITIQKALDSVKQIRESLTQLQQDPIQLLETNSRVSIGQLIVKASQEINQPVEFILRNIQDAEYYLQDLLGVLNFYQEHCGTLPEDLAVKFASINLSYIVEAFPQLLSSLKEEAECIRSLSTFLQTISLADRSSKVLFNICEGLDSSLRVLRDRLQDGPGRPEIQIIKNYGDIPPISCYPGLLNQVFVNLIINAIEALEELSEGCFDNQMNARPYQIKICTALSPDGTQVEIRIANTGLGITEEMQQHIFNPLLTTKPVSKRTGSGLSLSRTIVEDKHGGTLTCSSPPGRGTEFCIAIPL